MYLGQVDPYAALRDQLQHETDPLFALAQPLAGEALKRDNENFAFELFEILPPSESAALMVQLGVPAGPPLYMQVLAAMMMAYPASYMNLSLRAEITRFYLAQELQSATAPSLGSWFSEVVKGIENTYKRSVKSLSDAFSRLGRDLGRGLRRLGENVHGFREAMVKLGGPAMRYVTDFLILTPGVVFLFGDLVRELGSALEDGRRVNLLPIGAGLSRYLHDMSQALQVASVVLPPPWNMIAKVVAVLYKVGANVIDWQIAQHIQDLMTEYARANAKIRAELENALRAQFSGLWPELEVAGQMEPSEYGANTPRNPTGGRQFGGLMLLGIMAGAAAVLVLK